MIWLPKAVLAHEGIGEDQEFSHHCGEGDHSFFSFGDQAVIEGLEIGVVLDGGLGRHVEGVAQMPSAAADVTGAACFAGVAGDWSEAGEHGGFLRRERSDLLQFDDDDGGGGLADAWNGAEDFEAPATESQVAVMREAPPLA